MKGWQSSFFFYFSIGRQLCRVRRNYMEYEVEVIETLKRQKVIEADSVNEALEKLQDEYKNCNIILNENDFIDVEFRESTDEMIKEKFNTNDLLQDLMNAGGCDANDEYSKGWDEAIEEAYNIVCRHLNITKEKVKEDNACKII